MAPARVNGGMNLHAFSPRAIRALGILLVACFGACIAGPHPPPPSDDPEGVVISGVSCPMAPPSADRPADGTALPADVAATLAALEPQLAAALQRGEQGAIGAAVCAARAALGRWQGVAEAPASYRATPTSHPDAAALLPAYLATVSTELLGREPWLIAGESLDGEALSEPLRAACEVISAYAAILPAAGTRASELAGSIRRGASWLVRVQRPEGQFPFPDLSDDGERFLTGCRAAGQSEAQCQRQLPRSFELALRGRRAWEAAGRPPGVLVDGWFIHVDDGGLQFDTGTCGVALIAAARVLNEPRYLDAARRAGAWAEREVMVVNWNYNAFSVELMARLAVVERDLGNPTAARSWAADALRRARLGVLPGALPDGRWFDPHNARLTYHHIILRALGTLEHVVDDPWLSATVDAAYRRSVEEIERSGAAAWADGIEAYLAASTALRQPGTALDRLIHAAAPDGKPATLQVAAWLAHQLELGSGQGDDRGSSTRPPSM
jgi:hypothetical protein